MTNLIKDTLALKRLAERLAKPIQPFDNSAARAGSPMYFYCKICGYQSDVLPESYTSAPNRFCDECAALKKTNPDVTDTSLVELAKRADV